MVEELGGIELVEIEVEDPQRHEVLVRVEASGVCHSDLHVVETGFSHPPPILLGHEPGKASLPSTWWVGAPASAMTASKSAGLDPKRACRAAWPDCS